MASGAYGALLSAGGSTFGSPQNAGHSTIQPCRAGVPSARRNLVFYFTSVTGICERCITLVATEPRMRLPTVPMPRVPMMILSQR